MKFNTKFSLFLAAILISLGALYRVIPHLPNYTPITAMALLGGAVISRRWLAYLIPFTALYISDLVINNTVARPFFKEEGIIWFSDYMIWNFLAFGLIVLLASKLFNSNEKNLKVLNIAGASLTSSLLFFIITNFGAWIGSAIYPKSLEGLAMSYTAGLPYLAPTVLGDLVFSTLLFGSFYIVMKYAQSKNWNIA